MSPRIARFELDTLVASDKSGEGVLWRATDTATGAPVAVKVLAAPAPEGAKLDDALARTYAELAQSEPSLVPIIAIGTATVDPAVFAGRPAPSGRHGYCAMAWIDGPPLTATIAAGPLTAERAARLAADLAHRVATLHSAGIAHLGLKPSNILMAEAGPVLVDCRTVWGDLGDRRGGARAMSAASYLAPEQKPLPNQAPDAHTEPLGPRTDVYALGALLAALATGSHLPSDEALAEVDPFLRVIFERALNRDPELRFASAHGFASALEAYLAPDATGAVHAPPSRATLRRRITISAAIGTLMLTAGVVLWRSAHPSPAAPEPSTTRTHPAGASNPPRSPTTSQAPRPAPQLDPTAPHDFSAYLPSEPLNATTPEAIALAEALGRRANLALQNFTFHPADLELLRRTHGPLAADIAALVARFGSQADAPFATERRRLLQLFRPQTGDPAHDAAWLAFELERIANGAAPLTPHLSPRTLHANAILAGEGAAPWSAQAPTEVDHMYHAMAALRHGDGAAAQAALAELPRDSTALLGAVARFQTRGQSLAPSERAELEGLAARYSILNVEAGVLALDLGDDAAALEHFDRTLQRYPDHAGARHHRAIALWRLGRKAEARAELARLQAAAPDPPRTGAPFDWTSRSSATYLTPSDQAHQADRALAPLLAPGE